jgi:type IV pilus assembly protein PilC
MPRFKYRARNEAGAVLEGFADADNLELLKRTLRERNLWVTRAVIQTHFPWPSLFKSFRVRIKPIELVMFAKQMGVMIDSGIPLITALESIHESSSKSFQPVLVKVVEEVKSGKTYSAALALFPTVFSPFFVGMMEVGEAGGILADMHHKVSSHLEQAKELKSKLLMASLYPMIVLGVAILGIIIILTTAFPRIADIYVKYHVPLPFLTQVMMGLSWFIIHMWYIPLGILLGIIVLAAMRIHRQQPLKGFLDRIVFRVPVYNEFFRQVAMARYTHNLSLLLNSGLPVLKALDIIRTLFDNSIIRQYLSYLMLSVQEGEGLSKYLRSNRFFPPMLVSLTRTGEDSGRLPGMMKDASAFYETEVERGLKKFITIVEPVLIIIAAACVFMVLIAFYLPMFKLINVIKSKG